MHKYIDKLPTDSRLFVSRIIGAVKGGALASPLLILRYFNGLVNSKIKSVASEYMIKRQISFLEISQYLSELSDEFKDNLEDDFAGQAGHLFNNANPPANSMQAVIQPSSSVCCPNCGAQNPSGMKFCGECGNPLSSEIVCPRCGAHIPASMKWKIQQLILFLCCVREAC